MRYIGRIIKTKRATYKVIERESYFGCDGFWIVLLSGSHPGFTTKSGTKISFEHGDEMHVPVRFVKSKLG